MGVIRLVFCNKLRKIFTKPRVKKVQWPPGIRKITRRTIGAKGNHFLQVINNVTDSK